MGSSSLHFEVASFPLQYVREFGVANFYAVIDTLVDQDVDLVPCFQIPMECIEKSASVSRYRKIPYNLGETLTQH